MSFPLYFIDVPAFRAKRKIFEICRKSLKSIAFYSTRRASAPSRKLRFVGPKMRSPLYFTGANAFFCGGKIRRKSCGLRFPLYFTGRIAMSENRKVEISGQKENVSKPSAPRMKTTCLVSKGRSREAKTRELAETFDQN